MSCFAHLYNQFFSALLNGLAIGSVYALIALGLSMVYGVLGLINFAHGDVFTVGTFAAVGILLAFAGITGGSGVAVVAVLAFAALAAILASGMAAVVLELVAYRPLRHFGAPRHASMISGMGASILIEEILALWFGRGMIPYPDIYAQTVLLQVGDGRLTNKMVLIFASTLLMLAVLEYFVSGTRLGRGMRALAQDSAASAMMGVNASSIITITFLVGGLCAGLGGFLYGLYFDETSYLLGFLPGLKGMTASILGGIGNFRGAVVGGLVLGLVESFGTVCVPSQLRDVIAFSALVLVLLFRPRGILGEFIASHRSQA